MNHTQALIAMSGGVDSSVAAYLSLEQGLSCLGGTMRLLSGETDTRDAQAVAQRLGISFHQFDFS